MLTREQLESIVQKRKVSDVYQWFYEHFVSSTVQEYATRCPFLMIQGPTGCGKTTTLKCVARELKLPIREYGETTDMTAINYDLAQNNYYSEDDRSLDKRRANRFEHFVINHLRFNPLYPPTSDGPPPASADSEFDSDEDDLPASLRPAPRPIATSVIILVEAPLSFARSQKILMSTMARMIKTIRELAQKNPRRVAIVFENLETEREVVSLPTKFKQAIKMQTIKFNPIIKATMKKFIESKLRNLANVTIEKEAMESLVNDCGGDLRACLHTLQLLSNRIHNQSQNSSCMNLIDNDILDSFREPKRQRLNLELNLSLLRGVTRSVGFFHILGKIFYQKRLYPERCHFHNKIYRSVDRPYATENTTEYLSSRLDIDPKVLIAWLHQHYHNFCCDSSIEKASLFTSHLSDIDTISINATQSSQFFESHQTLDHIQLHLAIEATVFSLYEDQSKITKSSHKRVSTPRGHCVIVKSSVETNANSDLYSFGKPASLSINRLIDDRKTILSYCSEQILKHDLRCTDPNKMITDYIPYLCKMSEYCDSPVSTTPLASHKSESLQIFDDVESVKLIKLLGCLEEESKSDFDAQHEQLVAVIEEIEERTNIKSTKSEEG